MEIFTAQGICKEASLAYRLHTNYPCPFCHTNFINQEEVTEHMEICSGTDQEPEVLKLICPFCQKTFETFDKLEKPIGIHIMRKKKVSQSVSTMSTTRKSKLVTRTSLHEQTLNFQCIGQFDLFASNPFKQMTK